MMAAKVAADAGRHGLPLPYVLWRLLCEVISAVKAAIADVQVNVAILLSMLFKMVWLMPLLVSPDLFATNVPFYRAFAETGPQWVWAVFMGIFVLLDLASLHSRRFEMEIFTLGAGVFLFTSLSSMAYSGAPHGRLGLPAAPFCYLYGFGGVGCLVGMLLRAILWGTQNDARRLQMLGDLAQREVKAGRL